MMTDKPSPEELRDMLDEGMTLYQISRKYNTTILVIFQLEKEYDIKAKSFKLKECYRINKEDLKSMYIGEHMTQQQIAQELDCSGVHVHDLMKYYHITTRGRGKFTPEQRSLLYDEIEQMYNEGMTQEEIAKKFGYSLSNIWKILKERGVQARVPNSKYNAQQRASIIDEIIRLYNDEQLTQEQISEKVGYTSQYIGLILRERGVPTRPGGKFTPEQRALISDEIVRLHNDEHLIQEEIAEKVGYSRATVHRLLQERGIPTRGSRGTIASQKVSLITADKLQECIDKGMNQSQIAEHFGVHDKTIYILSEKFGILGMVDNYRCATPEHLRWRREVLERDNYTCQLCGSPERPEAHHIYPFRYYPERQFDVDNGITLCHWCHQKVTGHESEYIVELEDIVLRDRHIGDDIKPGIDYIDYLARKFDQKGVDIFGGELPTHEYTSIPKDE